MHTCTSTYAHRLSVSTEYKNVLCGWLGLEISTPEKKPLSSVTVKEYIKKYQTTGKCFPMFLLPCI